MKRPPSAHLRAISARKLLARLRKHAPVRAPIRLRRRLGVRCNGEWVLAVCSTHRRWTRGKWSKPTRYTITVDSRIGKGEAFDIIVHEYAHCIDRESRAKSKDCHDARWGRCYSRAFRAAYRDSKEPQP